MNDTEHPERFTEILNELARMAEPGSGIRQEAVKILNEQEQGVDVTKYMRNIRVQCLKCGEVFDSERQYRVHAGMREYCGGVPPEESRYEDMDDQMNVIVPGP